MKSITLKALILKALSLKAISAATMISLSALSPAQAALQQRIVGGVDVDISYFPSTVALLRTSTLNRTGSAYRSQFCGGTLIARNWVLTAAHCVEDDGVVSAADSLVILAGSTDLTAPVTLNTAVSRVIVHEDYRSAGLGNDIALLELATDAPAQAIAMTDTYTSGGELAYIAGWGALNDAEPGTRPEKPTLLQGATVTTQVRTDCDALPGLYRFFDAESQICASVPEGGVDTCSGDSGGPFYTVTKDNTLRLAGITSWGDGCAIKDKPGIYTDVLAYRGWISGYTGLPIVPTTITNNTNSTQLTDERFTTVGTRASASGVGASILFMPILMLLLCIRFKPFVLFRQ